MYASKNTCPPKRFMIQLVVHEVHSIHEIILLGITVTSGHKKYSKFFCSEGKDSWSMLIPANRTVCVYTNPNLNGTKHIAPI
mmetsp:Transcript_2261/g.3178  ORF Transcript_2261/g.3178 Transcript_2261/m.3178 type:complete len:82 (+) Transcript_2261:215-460(+)